MEAGLDPEENKQLTKYLVNKFATDKNFSRGFGVGEIYSILSAGKNAGLLSWQDTGDIKDRVKQFNNQLNYLLDTLAATRDILGPSGYYMDIPTLFTSSLKIIDNYRKMLPGADSQQLLDELRRQAYYKKISGGGFTQFVRSRLGKGNYLVTGEDPVKREFSLYMGAANSIYGNMAGVTARLAEEGMLPKNSPAYKFWENLKRGYFAPMSYTQWLDMMSSSGIDKNTLSIMMTQKDSNRAALSPELVYAVRRLQPMELQYWERLAKQLYPDNPVLQKGYLDELAAKAGYGISGVMVEEKDREGNQKYRPASPYEVARFYHPQELATRKFSPFEEATRAAQFQKEYAGIGIPGVTTAVEKVKQTRPLPEVLASLLGINIVPVEQGKTPEIPTIEPPGQKEQKPLDIKQ